jgi:anti-sigma regulatory factor (Ser/Thr protein kinase)
MEVISHDPHLLVPVVEASQPSAVRYAARELAARAGFNEEDSYRAGIVATELATNLVKHAQGGQILLRPAADGVPQLELIAIDRGPGIANLQQAMSDGQSTAGSSGNGLGAVRRLADDFDIYSSMPHGTAVLARIRAHRAPARHGPFLVAGVSVAKKGETECGDIWAVVERPDSVVAAMADGLGHGHFAAEAAAAAIATLRVGNYDDCAAAVTAMHNGIRHTRGAAGAVVELRRAAGVVRFAGVGNISAVVLSNGGTRQTVSHNGTLGHRMSHVREYSYPWSDGALIVMHSDGLVSHWSLGPYPGLRARHPALVAAILYREFDRGRDDVTVVVAREAA